MTTDVVDYLWKLIREGVTTDPEHAIVGLEYQIQAAEILDAYYGRRRAFGQIHDPNREAIEELQRWAVQVASSDSWPHQLRIRAAKLALSR